MPEHYSSMEIASLATMAALTFVLIAALFLEPAFAYTIILLLVVLAVLLTLFGLKKKGLQV